MQKVVFITAPKLLEMKNIYSLKILENAGIKVDTASTKIGTITRKIGHKAHGDMILESVKPSDYDAIVYVGGGGSSVL